MLRTTCYILILFIFIVCFFYETISIGDGASIFEFNVIMAQSIALKWCRFEADFGKSCG